MPTILTLPGGMPTLLDAYDTVLAGDPTDDERQSAPRLDEWTVEVGTVWPVLYGRPTGHPDLTQRMRTSPLLYVDASRGVARCLSRWYMLGTPGRIAPAPDVADTDTEVAQVVLTAWREHEEATIRTEQAVAAAIRGKPERLLATYGDQLEAPVAARLRTLVERWADAPRCVLYAGPDEEAS